jgi:hypothetical protein
MATILQFALLQGVFAFLIGLTSSTTVISCTEAGCACKDIDDHCGEYLRHHITIINLRIIKKIVVVANKGFHFPTTPPGQER